MGILSVQKGLFDFLCIKAGIVGEPQVSRQIFASLQAVPRSFVVSDFVNILLKQSYRNEIL